MASLTDAEQHRLLHLQRLDEAEATPRRFGTFGLLNVLLNVAFVVPLVITISNNARLSDEIKTMRKRLGEPNASACPATTNKTVELLSQCSDEYASFRPSQDTGQQICLQYLEGKDEVVADNDYINLRSDIKHVWVMSVDRGAIESWRQLSTLRDLDNTAMKSWLNGRTSSSVARPLPCADATQAAMRHHDRAYEWEHMLGIRPDTLEGKKASKWHRYGEYGPYDPPPHTPLERLPSGFPTKAEIESWYQGVLDGNPGYALDGYKEENAAATFAWTSAMTASRSLMKITAELFRMGDNVSYPICATWYGPALPSCTYTRNGVATSTQPWTTGQQLCAYGEGRFWGRYPQDKGAIAANRFADAVKECKPGVSEMLSSAELPSDESVALLTDGNQAYDEWADWVRSYYF